MNKKLANYIILSLLIFSIPNCSTKREKIQFKGEQYYVQRNYVKYSFKSFFLYLPQIILENNLKIEKNNDGSIKSIKSMNELVGYPNPKYKFVLETVNTLPEYFKNIIKKNHNNTRIVFDEDVDLGPKTFYLTEDYFVGLTILNDGGLLIYTIVNEQLNIIIQLEVANKFEITGEEIRNIISSIQFNNTKGRSFDLDSDSSLYRLDSANYRKTKK